MLKGIDVSKWQGKIDWNKAKSEIDFAILRCGYGGNSVNYDDSQFARNASECERLGIPYGVYLYSYATSVEAAKSEANHVLRLIKDKKLQYPVFYDLEDAKTTGTCSKTLILQMAKAFCEIIEKAGYVCGTYSNKDWYTNRLTDAWYSTRPKWLAQYNTKVTYTGSYDMWQYTSKGKVKGISGNVDMNYCYTDFVGNKEATKPADKDSFLPSRGYFTRGDSGTEIHKLCKFFAENFYGYFGNTKKTAKAKLLGTNGKGDYFGPNLYAWVKEFQKRTKLEQDGNIGPITLAKLESFGFKK